MLTRVVVTGSSGMLGTALARRLAESGCEVVGLDLAHRTDSPATRLVTGDIRDAALLRQVVKGADLVVHSASALPSYPSAQIDSVVVEGTRTVLAAAASENVPRVIHLSTGSVYGLPTQVPTPETHPRRPIDPYGTAKARAEELVEEARADGMVVPVLRPKTFLGPGRLGIFSMLFEWADEGHHFPVLGDGRVRSQMLDVEDLIDVILLAAEAPAEAVNTEFNVGSAEFGTLREDFQTVLDAAGHGKRVIGLPMRPAVAALELLARARLSPVYMRLIHKLRMDSYMDITRMRERLGFTPRHSNREAILRSFAWWRSQPRGGGAAAGGRTSRDAWGQGALKLAKAVF
ncbi:NAD-dependent epimerase/dehydratase family protein [Streptomyces sp. NPDC014676]|uniref:NAD-dependent epimerase/dehydratase family protein n=1 Tax=Streptomyces sp. NPDC014676 TaxID=3364879 RepID=UPI003700E4E2